MKFIADIMLGKLARYLRIAGNDVLYFNNISDNDILRIAKDQDRIILTRDSLMLKRRECKNKTAGSIFIKEDDIYGQLRQVKDELGVNMAPLLIRCTKCNSLLEKVSKPETEGKVPIYVFKTQEYFLYCTSCSKYFWRGTHYDNIRRTFKLFD
jgi:uncharacterized protein with PIN domain